MRLAAPTVFSAAIAALCGCNDPSSPGDSLHDDASIEVGSPKSDAKADTSIDDAAFTDIATTETSSPDDGDAHADIGQDDIRIVDAIDTGDAVDSRDSGTPFDPPPVIPVGPDGFRRLDTWPAIAIGTRSYMRSTYDRAGANEGADASHFLRAEVGQHISLDVTGAGFVNFVRTNHWHGSPWHYGVDGRDVVVSETSTATPNAPVDPSTFIPAALFPPPLALTWSTTRGADLERTFVSRLFVRRAVTDVLPLRIELEAVHKVI